MFSLLKKILMHIKMIEKTTKAKENQIYIKKQKIFLKKNKKK